MIQLPNNKKCYNLPEQVAQNLANITYLAEEYKNIDELPSIWQTYKETFDAEQETFGEWTTTFEGWDTTLATYLANMSSAAVGAIAGQNIAPANITATNITATNISGTAVTGDSIIENMSGYAMEVIDDTPNISVTGIYASIVKNGNKLTLVFFLKLNRSGAVSPGYLQTKLLAGIPASIGAKLYDYSIGGLPNVLSTFKGTAYKAYDSSIDLDCVLYKYSNTSLYINIYGVNDLDLNTDYLLRIEQTFLLSDSLLA